MSPMPKPPTPQDLLKHHVTGAIERGESEAIECISALEAFLESEKRPMLANLRIIVKDCKREIRKDRELYIDGEHDEPSIDIRLCVDPVVEGFDWIFRIGSASYDQKHSVWCGASCIGLDSEPETLLEELTKQLGE